MSAPMFVARSAVLFIPDLVAHWPMNEGGGTAINDISGSGFNGTIVGATWTTPGYTGSGPVLSFDGVNDYVNFGDIFYYDAMTISLRAYTLVNNAIKQIILKRNSSGVSSSSTNEFSMDTSATGKISCNSWDSGGAISQAVGTTTISTSTWYHLVYKKAGAGDAIDLYINNVSDATVTQGNATLNTTNTLQLGARSANNDTRYWSGFIQDVRIYSRALNSEEITALYEGTAA